MKKEMFKKKPDNFFRIVKPFDYFWSNPYWENDNFLISDIDSKETLELRGNLTEDKNNYYLEVDLPGIKKEDIKIDVLDENTLRISGEKKIVHEEKEKTSHYLERQYGYFSREFDLPSSFNKESIEANYKDGVLLVNIPKKNEEKTCRIEVK